MIPGKYTPKELRMHFLALYLNSEGAFTGVWTPGLSSCTTRSSERRWESEDALEGYKPVP